jgi:RimJ/RimL family protein N-acetyltransferase
MNQKKYAYFGSSDNQRIQRRAEAIWELVKDDPRYCCHGRAISLAEGFEDNIQLQASLSLLQGVGICDSVPSWHIEDRRSALEKLGLRVEQMEIFRGGTHTISSARSVVSERNLPEDLELIYLDERTSKTVFQKIDAFTQHHGASLPMKSFLLKTGTRSVCLAALDGDGNVVGTSAAGAHFNRNHARCDEAFWGMLATSEDRREQGIALLLGSLCMLAMNERHGFDKFFTCIKKGNTPSERLCAKLGLKPDDTSAVFSIDPDFFPDGETDCVSQSIPEPI